MPRDQYEEQLQMHADYIDYTNDLLEQCSEDEDVVAEIVDSTFDDEPGAWYTLKVEATGQIPSTLPEEMFDSVLDKLEEFVREGRILSAKQKAARRSG